MTVSSASNALNWFAHEPDNEQSKLESNPWNTMQSSKNKEKCSINSAHYELLKHWDQQTDWHNAVKRLVDDLRMDWQEDFAVQDEYFAYCHNVCRFS